MSKTKLTDNGYLKFWCPGCREVHAIALDRWRWNGDREKPTFHPSVKVTSGHYVTAHKKGVDHCWCTYYAQHPEKEPAFKCGICHSWVKEGKIQFLSDSTHELAGQTVELQELPHA